ncbi:MAG: hypothetical protein R3C15_17915 [Thermoleophilia bacterium]
MRTPPGTPSPRRRASTSRSGGRGERPDRGARGAVGRPPRPAARPRLHQGPPEHRGQQPPDSPRVRGRRVHNGVIDNDDAVFRRRGWRRHEPEMTVDSEVIFASVEHRCDEVVLALEELRGTMAAAWLDEREPGALHVARGARRPLWLGVGRRELLFASTREALLLASRYARVELELEEVAEGTLLRVADGRIGERTGFRPDHGASRSPVVPMRSRQEQVACLARLQAIAAVA